MDKNTIEQLIDKTSEMYRKENSEATQLSAKYDEILEELSDSEITHHRYVSLQESLKVVGGEVNNRLHVAQGISDVREMLFELLK